MKTTTAFLKRLAILAKVLALMVSFCLLYTDMANAACGCTQMKLKYQNAIDGAHSTNYCVDSPATFDECVEVNPNICGVGKKTWNCPIGGAYGTDSNGDPWIGVGFEVVATLPNGTNLGDCTYGQGIQRTLTEDGSPVANGMTNQSQPQGNVSYTNVNARLYSNTATPIPTLGTTDSNGRLKLAADDFTVLSSQQTISYDSGTHTLRWSDFPSIYVDGDTTKTVVVTDRFITFVKDSNNGTVYCACKFTTTGTKNIGTDDLSSVTSNQETGINCVYEAQ